MCLVTFFFIFINVKLHKVRAVFLKLFEYVCWPEVATRGLQHNAIAYVFKWYIYFFYVCIHCVTHSQAASYVVSFTDSYLRNSLYSIEQ